MSHDAGVATIPDPDVIACGALVFRRGRVLLVHRPKYDDWSFPKGKRDPGESDARAAVREVLEETGVEIRLGRPLPSMAYVMRDGNTKIVHYWRGIVIGDPDVSGYQPNPEIDRVEWVPAEQARSLLTYERDRKLFDEALGLRRKTQALIVARHAKAVPRKRWTGTREGLSDTQRPLEPRGEEQAAMIAPTLAAYGVTTLVASDSTRCLQTLQPYADEHVLPISALPCLSEELTDQQMIEAELKHLMSTPESAAVCTHRPVLPLLFDALGVVAEPLQVGDLVVVHHRAGSIVAVEHHAMPED